MIIPSIAQFRKLESFEKTEKILALLVYFLSFIASLHIYAHNKRQQRDYIYTWNMII
jgi:hypothetical protein